MTTLFDAKLDLAQLLMRVKHSKATQLGVAGQLIDSTRVEPGDYFFRTLSNGGIIFFKESSDSREIIDFVDGVFAFTPANVTIVVGDRYAASPVDWEFNELTEAINMGLEDLGEESGIPQIDETLDIVADQHIYTLPAGVYNVKQVHMVLDDTAPEDWTERHMSWDEVAGDLVLDQGSAPAWGDNIKLVYCAPHAAVVDDDDVISPYVNPMLLKWASAVYALENINKDARSIAKLNRAIKTTETYKTRHPLEMQRDPHLAYFPDESGY
jgi:hypothetical protein